MSQSTEHNPKDSHKYQFVNCLLDPASRTLTRAGESIDIQSQVFDLLYYLVRHRNQVITKQVLLEQVWGHTHLTDATIGQAIRKARQAVGDDGKRQEIIRTVHGQGFNFVAAVRVLSEQQTKTESISEQANKTSPATISPTHKAGIQRKAWMVGLFLLAVFTVGIISVLQQDNRLQARAAQTLSLFPFSNNTGNEDLDWFEHGLAGTVGMLLEQAGEFKVRSPDRDSDELADGDLAARTAIFGSLVGMTAAISMEDEQFKVSWQVVQAGDKLTQGSFKTASSTTIARQLAERFLEEINARPSIPIAELPLLKDALALELYSRGTEALYRDDRPQAIALLQAAQARAPQLPMLQVATAVANFDAGNVSQSLAVYREQLDALPADAGDARAQLEYEIGTRSWFAGAIDEAEILLEKVVLQTSTDSALHATALNSLALVLQSQSRYDEAWERARQAEVRFEQMNDPYHLSMVLTNLGYMAEDLGRLSEAGDHHQGALDIRQRYQFPSLIAASQYGLARIERRQGNFERADVLLNESLTTVRAMQLPFDEFDNLEELAELRMRQGRFDESLETLNAARALAIEADDPLGVAWADEVAVRLQIRQGTADRETLTKISSVLAAFKDMGDLENARLAELELVHVQILLGELANATAALEAIDTAPIKRNPALDIYWQQLSAELMLLKGDDLGAEQAFADAMRIARKTGVQDLEAELALRLGQLALQNQELATAQRLLAIAQSWSGDYYRTELLAAGITAASK